MLNFFVNWTSGTNTSWLSPEDLGQNFMENITFDV